MATIKISLEFWSWKNTLLCYHPHWTYLTPKCKGNSSFWWIEKYIYKNDDGMSALTLLRMRMGGGGGLGGATKEAPTSFSSVTSSNVRVSPQNFLTSSFNIFVTLLKVSRPCLISVLNCWTWSKTTSQKICFLVKSLWNQSYDNLSHRYARVTKLRWHDNDWIYNIIHDCWWPHEQKLRCHSICFGILNYFKEIWSS